MRYDQKEVKDKDALIYNDNEIEYKKTHTKANKKDNKTRQDKTRHQKT